MIQLRKWRTAWLKKSYNLKFESDTNQDFLRLCYLLSFWGALMIEYMKLIRCNMLCPCLSKKIKWYCNIFKLTMKEFRFPIFSEPKPGFCCTLSSLWKKVSCGSFSNFLMFQNPINWHMTSTCQSAVKIWPWISSS